MFQLQNILSDTITTAN